ncbi:MAG: hypothetical protein ACR2PW_00890 [Gammaproteobacteria bacterium]
MSRETRFAWQGMLVLLLPFVVLFAALVLRWSGEYRGIPESIELLPESVQWEELQTFTGRSRWRLLLLAQPRCNAHCQAQLTQLQLWRTAMGRRSRQLDIVYLYTNGDGFTEAALSAALPSQSQGVLFQSVSPGLWDAMAELADPTELASGQPPVFVMDPAQRVIARVPAAASSQAVLDDLSVLVR